MSLKVAVNGFGRIGRCVVRAIFEYADQYDIELVAINSTASASDTCHLLKYDSVHGRFVKSCEVTEDHLVIDQKKVRLFSERDVANLDWKSLDIDVVFECTGVFQDQKTCSKHLEQGAKKVIISAPAKDDETKTIVYGVNQDILTREDNIISVGSCTTNCLAPVAKIFHDEIGIVKGFVSTIHAYTNDQNLADNRHRDLRRARAAALSMIPTSTGAAKAIGKVIPALSGKLDGVAIRVPTPNVSLIDFTFLAARSVTKEEINNLALSASKGALAGVLSYEDEALVSIDYNHFEASAAFDSTSTKVLDNDFVRVAAWYDNEWAFSKRMLDVALLMA